MTLLPWDTASAEALCLKARKLEYSGPIAFEGVHTLITYSVDTPVPNGFDVHGLYSFLLSDSPSPRSYKVYESRYGSLRMGNGRTFVDDTLNALSGLAMAQGGTLVVWKSRLFSVDLHDTGGESLIVWVTPCKFIF